MPETRTSRFGITDLHCVNCAKTVEKGLFHLKGITKANVNFTTNTAHVEFEPGLISLPDILENIRRTGYTPALQSMKIPVAGMDCPSCGLTIEKSIGQIPGVASVSVNVVDGSAVIAYDPDKTGFEKFRSAVEKSGYSIPETGRTGTVRKKLSATDRLLIALFSVIPVTVLMVLHMTGKVHLHGMAWIELVLSFPAVFIAGSEIHRKAWAGVRMASLNMEALLSLGSLVAWLTGFLSFFLPSVTSYAGLSSMVILLNLIGRHLEARARNRASDAIKSLMALSPPLARIIRKGKELVIKTEELESGMVLVSRPGEKIAADGIVVGGSASVDESLVTGESTAVLKKMSSPVTGSTIVLDGFLKIRVTKTGNASFLGSVIKLMETAQSQKVPVQALADRITSWFVPFVMAVSLLSFLSWLVFPSSMLKAVAMFRFLPWVSGLSGQPISLGIMSAISVLVISCPCALGLAIPAALTVVSGEASRRGILIRGLEAIQTLSATRTIVVDKTGTLTKGKPKVTSVETISISRNKLIKIAASLESLSEHPLAKAISSLHRGLKSKVSDFKAVPGQGVEGRIQGEKYLIGTVKFLRSNRIGLPAYTVKHDETSQAIYVAGKRKLLGIFRLEDEIRMDSADAVKRLEKAGIKVVMLTGDSASVAGVVAEKTGIQEFHAGLLPGQKAGMVKSLQSGGRLVAMVGDGINDAPSLRQANVGIAIGSGTDIAMESADLVLTRNGLTALADAVDLSRLAFRKIRQNLFWAFIYNIVAVPVAFLGLLHPLIAEAAMSFSSINVILNALSIRRRKTALRT